MNENTQARVRFIDSKPHQNTDCRIKGKNVKSQSVLDGSWRNFVERKKFLHCIINANSEEDKTRQSSPHSSQSTSVIRFQYPSRTCSNFEKSRSKLVDAEDCAVHSVCTKSLSPKQLHECAAKFGPIASTSVGHLITEDNHTRVNGESAKRMCRQCSS